MTGKDIRKALEGDIRSGKFTKTGKLPSEAQLCRRFGVARGTVREALAALQREGLIEKRNGAGSFLTRLAERRTGLIGLVIPDYVRFSFFADVKDRIEHLARRLKFNVRLVSTDKTNTADAIDDILPHVRSLVADKAEGVIFRPFVASKDENGNREIASLLQEAGVPLVLLDQDIVQPPERSEFDLVAVNNVNAGRRIAGHLFAHGYRRVAFLMGRRGFDPNANWNNRLFGLAGELALRNADEVVRTLRFRPDNTAALLRAMSSPQRPDAIVCGNDESAVALLASLKSLGFKVPEDIGIVGFDDLECARLSSPQITTIRQPVQQIAEMAFKTLLARIRYPQNSPRETYLQAPLVIRDSTTAKAPPRQIFKHGQS